MVWGRLEDTFHDEPKFFRLAERLGISFAQAAGHIACLWSWAHRHAPDGDLRDYDVPDIARAAKWDGDPVLFVSVLEADRIELLDRTEHGLIIHEFATRAEAHKAAKKKAKQRKARVKRKRVPGQSPDSPGNVPEEREEREDREESVIARERADAAPAAPEHARVIDTSPSRKAKVMEPFGLAEYRRLCLEYDRPLPDNHDPGDARAIGIVMQKYAKGERWKAVLRQYVSDDFYGRYGWSLANLAKNLDAIANRKSQDPSTIDVGF